MNIKTRFKEAIVATCAFPVGAVRGIGEALTFPSTVSDSATLLGKAIVISAVPVLLPIFALDEGATEVTCALMDYRSKRGEAYLILG